MSDDAARGRPRLRLGARVPPRCGPVTPRRQSRRRSLQLALWNGDVVGVTTQCARVQVKQEPRTLRMDRVSRPRLDTALRFVPRLDVVREQSAHVATTRPGSPAAW